MSKQFKKTIYFSLLLGLPIISSCDTSPENNDSEISLLNRGFDVASLSSMPTETAPFPIALASNETLVIDLPDLNTVTVAETLNLTVNTSGQTLIDRYIYDYRRGSADFRDVTTQVDESELRLSESHSFDEDLLESQFADLVRSGIGISGSLAEALLVDARVNDNFAQFNDSEVRTILNAARSLGYQARINTISRRFEVRVNQLYSFVSSGNNSDLVNNMLISGTVTESTQWRGLLFESPADDDGNVLLGARYTIRVQDGILSNDNRTGTFTLNLNSLTEI